MYPYDVIDQQNYLIHHGIKGQRWGFRRFQNDDGSLTDAGKRRYRTDDAGEARKEHARRVAAGAAAGALAGISTIQTIHNYKNQEKFARWATDGMFGTAPKKVWAKAGVKAAGKAAIIGALSTYGTLKLTDPRFRNVTKHKATTLSGALKEKVNEEMKKLKDDPRFNPNKRSNAMNEKPSDWRKKGNI